MVELFKQPAMIAYLCLLAVMLLLMRYYAKVCLQDYHKLMDGR